MWCIGRVRKLEPANNDGGVERIGEKDFQLLDGTYDWPMKLGPVN